MSKAKKLIVAAIILVLLIAAVIIVPKLQGNNAPAEENSQQESSSYTSTAEDFFERQVTDIDRIQVKNSTLEYVLKQIQKETTDSNGQKTTEQVWKLEGHENWDIVSSATNSLATLGTTLKKVDTANETKNGVLANYGLADPAVSVTVYYTDGTSVTIDIGDLTPDGIYRYAVLSDRDGVYTVYKSTLNYAEYDYTALRSTDIHQVNVNDTLYYLLLEKKGERPIEIQMKADGEEHEGVFDMSEYNLLKPYTTNNAVVSGDLKEKFGAYEKISIQKLIEADAADLAKYGLADDDFEYHVKITTQYVESTTKADDGTSIPNYGYDTVDYYFGKEAAEEEGCIYFRQGGESDVYTVNAATVDQYDFEPLNYVQKLIFIYEIDKLESFELIGKSTYDGEEKHFTGTFLRQDESEATMDEFSRLQVLESYYMNGVLVDEDLFKSVYQFMIGLMFDYESEDPGELDPSTKILMRYTTLDGVVYETEYYRLNEFFYVTKWGDTWMNVNAKQVNELWEKVAELEESMK